MAQIRMAGGETMKDDINQDHAGVKIPPPVIYFGLVFLGWGMNKLFPAPIGVSFIFKCIGLIVVVMSIVLVAYVAVIFKKENTEIKPWLSTRKIIDYGPYAFSRNPIYVFGCGIPLGLSLVFDSYWVLFSFIPALMIVYHTAVKKEECYLQKKFGEEYLNYKSRVRRWL